MGVHDGVPEASASAPAVSGRIASIDALRGLVMVLMLLDHLRETWFLHVPVADPVDARTALSVLALTKYPPSLLFLLLTLGIGALLLVALERTRDASAVAALAVFGGAPMFFYLLHLTVLRLLYHSAAAVWGPTQGSVFGVASYGWILAWYVGLIVPLYWPTAWFSRFKASRRDFAWLRYL